MNNLPRIFVDADSCPRPVRAVILTKAAELSLEVIFAANRNIPFEIENPLFKMIICREGKDSADDFIVSSMQENDIAVTSDMLLADRLVKSGRTVINDRGTVFTKENIVRFLEERELSLQMEALGLHKGKSSRSFGPKEEALFKECFYKILDTLIRNIKSNC